MKQRLFQYAVLWHPKEQKAGHVEVGTITGSSEKSKIVTDLTTILAQDERTVGIIAARGIPEEYLSTLDQIEVIVRPF